MQRASLFNTATLDKPTDTVNEAGGRAYIHEPQETLARLVVTGFFGDAYYASAAEQVEQVKEWAAKCDSGFLSDLAIYARKSAFMKDTPVALLAILHARKDADSLTALDRAFPFVVDNGRMLRGFVQMIRSGVFGRKSLGHHVRKLIGNWINNRDLLKLWDDAIGDNPSLIDVIKLSHFKPTDKKREDLVKYLFDSSTVSYELPLEVLNFEAFKGDPNSRELPKVSFQRLTALNLTPKHWVEIAGNMTWTQTRMNLNTLLRHGVLSDSERVDFLADRLRDKEAIRKSKVFPYQIFTAFKHVDDKLPMPLKLALQDALEIATENVPSYGMKVAVCVDSSGSMQSAITGGRGSVTSKINCNEVAGLIAATVLRTNADAHIVSFDTAARVEQLNPRDSITTNAKTLSRNGGGTDCGSPIELLNKWKYATDLVIMVSDNESWAGYAGRKGSYAQSTTLLEAWTKFKSWNKKAKLVLIDLQMTASSQIPNGHKDVLFVGGFSDGVFEAIGRWLNGDGDFVATVKNFAGNKIAQSLLEAAVNGSENAHQPFVTQSLDFPPPLKGITWVGIPPELAVEQAGETPET